MIKQATVEDVGNRRVTRRHGRIVVVTHYYPRFLKRNLIDEYLKSLAPSRELLTEFKDKEKLLADHDKAFEAIDYEMKFSLNEDGGVELERLSLIAAESPVYLVCHCSIGQRCHRELLMVLAAERFAAPIGKLSFSWSVYRERLGRERLGRGGPRAESL